MNGEHPRELESPPQPRYHHINWLCPNCNLGHRQLAIEGKSIVWCEHCDKEFVLDVGVTVQYAMYNLEFSGVANAIPEKMY